MYRTRDVVDMAMRGIPEMYRTEIWMVYSGMYVYLCVYIPTRGSVSKAS